MLLKDFQEEVQVRLGFQVKNQRLAQTVSSNVARIIAMPSFFSNLNLCKSVISRFERFSLFVT